jgi:hypothetical protein
MRLSEATGNVNLRAEIGWQLRQFSRLWILNWQTTKKAGYSDE